MIKTIKNNADVATGMSYGALAKDEHARQAVQNALAKLPHNSPGSVILFLSCGYAHNPQSAITEAVKAASTPQVFGCCALGLLTDEEWLIDAEGAVAMVFSHNLNLQPLALMQQSGLTAKSLLTLATPNAANIAINSSEIGQVGSITTDEYGHGPFAVWQSGRIIEKEFSHIAFSNDLNSIHKVAHGIRQTSPIMQIEKADKHRLIKVNGTNAVDNLRQNLPENLQTMSSEQPYNLLCAVSENTNIESIENGHYKLQHVVANDQEEGHIHLSGSVMEGKYIFWAHRDDQAAEKVIRDLLLETKQQLAKEKKTAKFFLMFPNLGRGAEFYNGTDKDYDIFKEIFPDTPMIGFYGNGEIAPGHEIAGLIHRYSTVFSVYY